MRRDFRSGKGIYRKQLRPRRLAADTAYRTDKFLAFVTGAGIIPHIPVWDVSKRADGAFPRSEFGSAHLKTHHRFERTRLHGLVECNLFRDRARISLIRDHEDKNFCTLIRAWIQGR